MRLIAIGLKNFRAHAQTDVVFERDGISGIVGSNEAGKSTLATEALLVAFFGWNVIRGTKKGLRWKRAPKSHQAEVRLRFEIANHEFEVWRDERDAKVWQLDEARACVADGTTPANQFLAGLLGMNAEEFTASYLVLQKDVARIATMKPAEREQFVRRVMGVERIDAGVKECRTEKNEAGALLAGMQAGLGQRAPLVAAAAAAGEAEWNADRDAQSKGQDSVDRAIALAARAASLSTSNKRKAEHDRVEQQIREGTTKLNAASARIEALAKDVERQQDAAARVKGADFSLAELPALREEQRDLIAARERTSQLPSMRKRMEQIAAEIDGPGGIDDVLADARRQLTFHDPEKLAAANKRAIETDRKVDALRDARLDALGDHRSGARAEADRISRLTAQLRGLRALGAAADCPTCTRPLAEQFDSVCATLEAEAEGHRAALLVHNTEVARLAAPSDEEMAAEAERDAVDKAHDELLQFERDAQLAQSAILRLTADRAAAMEDVADLERRIAEASTVPFSAERLNEVGRLIQQLEQKDRALAADRGLAAQLDATRAALAAAEEEEADASLSLDMLAEARHQVGFDPQAHATIEAEAEAARKVLEDARVALARAEEAHRAARQQAASAAKALADYDSRAEEMGDVQRRHDALVRADARLAEFKTSVVGMIRPELEELTSGYVQTLTDGRHEAVSLDEQFGMTLYENGVPMEVVSGGCEDVAALAMRLAISQMIAERAGHPLELLVLDEPFGSQDEVRRGNVLSLIRRLGKVFRQVLVISHVAETRDAVDFVIELEHDEAAGMTRVVTQGVIA